MLNPVHLRTLDAVMRTGSFADAARSLGYTGSAVSQQMAALERQLHTALFERDAHGVRPTSAAEYVARRSVESLGSLRLLEDDVRRMLDGSVGRVRLGSFAGASRTIVARALPALGRSAPGVDVDLVEGDTSALVPALLARELDVAVVRQDGAVPAAWPAGLDSLTILDEPLLLLLPAGHRWLADTGRGLEALRGERWVCGGDASEAGALTRRVCAAAGFEPEVRYRSDDDATVRALVAAGLGPAVVGGLDHLPTPGVAAVPLDGPRSRRPVVVLRSSGAPPALAAGLVAALAKAAAEPTERGWSDRDGGRT